MEPSELKGLIPDELGEELSRLASTVEPDLAVVEIGSFKGKSTCYLASGAASGRGAHVWAVDPWDLAGNVTGRFGFAEPETRLAFEAQVRDAGLEDRITAVRAFSVDAARAWDGPKVGMLYVDGDHTESGVQADFDAWEQHLVDGATVAFDDLDTPKNPGVRVAVDKLVSGGRISPIDVRAGRLAVARYPA